MSNPTNNLGINDDAIRAMVEGAVRHAVSKQVSRRVRAVLPPDVQRRWDEAVDLEVKRVAESQEFRDAIKATLLATPSGGQR